MTRGYRQLGSIGLALTVATLPTGVHAAEPAPPNAVPLDRRPRTSTAAMPQDLRPRESTEALRPAPPPPPTPPLELEPTQPDLGLERRRLAGAVALLATGAAVVVGATALGFTDPCLRAAGNSCQVSARNRAAWTMGIPGAAAIATGAVLLGLVLRERRRARNLAGRAWVLAF